jgi:hypothetical protein
LACSPSNVGEHKNVLGAALRSRVPNAGDCCTVVGAVFKRASKESTRVVVDSILLETASNAVLVSSARSHKSPNTLSADTCEDPIALSESRVLCIMVWNPVNCFAMTSNFAARSSTDYAISR